MRSFLSPLAVAALVVGAASPAAAQQLAVSSNYTPSATPAASAPADEAVLRTVAIYKFARSRDAYMPSEVTVADSSGTLVASYRVKGSGTVRPMTVEPLAADLLLQAQTDAGVLTFVIFGHGDPDVKSPQLGMWMLGARQGDLLRVIVR